jgi:hypothetical protein
LPSSTNDLVRTSYHEAGHAVVAERFSLRVKRVSIEPTRVERLGETIIAKMRRKLPYRAHPEARWRVLTLFAGPIAASRAAGENPLAGLGEHGASSDLDRIHKLAEAHDLNLGKLLARAILTVEKRWPEIQRVAHALTRDRTLSSAEIRKAMTGPTLSKQKAGYVDVSPMKFEKCANCSMFLPPGRCTLVRGPVKPGAWCERYFPAGPRREGASSWGTAGRGVAQCPLTVSDSCH